MDEFIDDSEAEPMTESERREFDNLLKMFRRGVIARDPQKLRRLKTHYAASSEPDARLNNSSTG